MNSRESRIPPLGALRGFEAAARLGSFSRAADELNMTQSAISHQIKSLEGFFDQPLFERVGRSVELTDAGYDFLQTAKRSLTVLSQGTRRLEAYSDPGQVVVSTTASFASRWLLPQFSHLFTEHPNIKPWLYTTDEFIDLHRTEVDVAIRLGSGDWPDAHSVKLIDDWVTPMCSPQMFQSLKAAQFPEDLAGYQLLHDERLDGWQSWFQFQDVHRTKPQSGMNFSDPGLALECAMNGHGLAMGSLILADQLLRDGKLCRPFQTAMKTSDSYFAVSLDDNLHRPETRQFWDWLISRRSNLKDLLNEHVPEAA